MPRKQETTRSHPQSADPQGPARGGIDRRAFLRGAAALGVGGFGATTVRAQNARSDAAPVIQPAAELLDARTARAQRWAARDPADWVRTRSGTDHNVLIVGGGQSGMAIAYGLKRKGVGRVEVIDQAEPGQAGIWRSIARMHQLRTPKTLAGPEQDNPMLSFRAWYETLNGPEAFDALDRIPRLAWADYLGWYQRVTGTSVRYRTRLLEIEPQGDLLRLHLESEGVRRVAITRKLVLANGYAGAGGPNVPDFIRTLPADFWSHTASLIPFDRLAGKVVAIVGAGSSAFDAAAVALESGAMQVHMFNRRSYVDYPGGSRSTGPSDRGHANLLELSYELPDVVRWRNFVQREDRVASVPPDSIERVMGYDAFRLHLEASLRDVALVDGRVAASVGNDAYRFDYIVAGTGYRIDLSAQPELAGIHASIARWRDRYEPERGEDNEAAGLHPYLGPGFELLAREGADAGYLRNIHCFNLAGGVSFGIPVGDIPSAVDHPRLVSAIARDLYVESVNIAAHRSFITAPITPADPAPYQRAI